MSKTAQITRRKKKAEAIAKACSSVLELRDTVFDIDDELLICRVDDLIIRLGQLSANKQAESSRRYVDRVS